MSTIVKGIYRDGQVRLLETPEGVEEAHRQLLLKRLREHSFDLGGAPYPTRDELHDRGR